jgi:hypothetical protein
VNRGRHAVGAAGLVFVTVFALAAPATAEPSPKPSTPSVEQPPKPGAVPYGYASWDALYAFQDRLHAAAQGILAAGGAGNASLVTDLENHELRVYWHGDVPPKVSSLAAGLGVPVVFLPAQFTHSELAKQAEQLATSKRVIEAAPKADGSGLAITVPDQLSEDGLAALRASSRIPLSVTVAAVPQPLFNRQADVPLFWGGSRYSSDGNCTNGFAVQAPATQNIVMISAGHCGNNSDAANIPGQATPAGVIHSKSQCRDTLLIYYPAGVSPSIYVGDPNSYSHADITGATFDIVGDMVNTGGASSGEHSDITVREVDVFTPIEDNPCAAVGPMTRASSSVPGTCAVAPGDSGGPVYTRIGTTAVARGTITAGMVGTANCPGVDPIGSDALLYAPLVRPAGDAQIGSLAFYHSTIMCPGCLTQTAVPQLVGLNEFDALDALGAAGLSQGIVTDVTDNTCSHVGVVASQSPSAGTLVNPGTTVNYSVFRAPPPPAECP